MITIHTVGGGCFRVKHFREAPTASRAFCPAEWHTDSDWIPGMEWIEAVTEDGPVTFIQVAHIEYIQQKVGQ